MTSVFYLLEKKSQYPFLVMPQVVHKKLGNVKQTSSGNCGSLGFMTNHVAKLLLNKYFTTHLICEGNLQAYHRIQFFLSWMIVHGGCQVSWTAAGSGADSWDGRSWWPCGSQRLHHHHHVLYTLLLFPPHVGAGRQGAGRDRVVCCERLGRYTGGD